MVLSMYPDCMVTKKDKHVLDIIIPNVGLKFQKTIGINTKILCKKSSKDMACLFVFMMWNLPDIFPPINLVNALRVHCKANRIGLFVTS